MLGDLYRTGLGLLTDLYQLTMAYGYWKAGRHRWPSVFHWTLRRLPYRGGFAVACGQSTVAELIEDYRFEEADLSYLAGLRGNDDEPLFEDEFLRDLSDLEEDVGALSVDAVAEGSIGFAREPLLRVEGPLWLCQMLETPLLNQLNFQTLIATKAARVSHLAARGQPVIEFGLRRAQGIDGGVTAARAAYVGGCAGTSNLLAGRLYGIPVMGTHAHSWVLAFEDELAAFRSYARAQPNNATLLVDTFDTETGVERAIEVGLEMKERGERLAGIRLDSGDLGELSIAARRRLDAAGLADVAIVASSDLDELRIAELRASGSRIDVWGVGTRLSTGHPDAALAGVYKLGALRPSEDEPWRAVMKVSENRAKRTEPGRLEVRRYRGEDDRLLGDAVWQSDLGRPAVASGRVELVDPLGGERVRIEAIAGEEDVLVPLIRAGSRVGTAGDGGEAESGQVGFDLAAARDRVAKELARLPEEARGLEDAEPPPVALEPRLAALGDQLARSLLGESEPI